MSYSLFSRIRDIALLCALVCLVKAAFERTSSFITHHKKSIVHELNRTFIDKIYTAQRQLHILQENHVHNYEIALQLTDIKQRLATIEEKYKTNSPGIMLLGPIGSAAIIAKEEKLQKKLLEIVNDLNKVLHTINKSNDEFRSTETINLALDSNKKLLQTISSRAL